MEYVRWRDLKAAMRHAEARGDGRTGQRERRVDLAQGGHGTALVFVEMTSSKARAEYRQARF